jgi:UDP-N-acetylmuramate--alanine ligase
VAAAISACQQICPTVMAYFQPHGFGPLRFMHKDLALDVDAALRSSDVFLIGDVYYAGGTVNKDICPSIVSEAMTGNAVFVGNKENASAYIAENIQDNTVLLVMGARDPNLSEFGLQVFEFLKLNCAMSAT